MDYNLILESLLYISPKFRNILKEINHVIAEDLLKIEGSDIPSDISFIDIDDSGNVNFLHMKNAKKRINKFDPYNTINGLSYIDTDFNSELVDVIYNIDNSGNAVRPGIYNSNSRNSIKIGRLINSVFPSKYSDRQIEEFVNILKSQIKSGEYHFELVKGDDIRSGYSLKNYSSLTGTIGNSCMNNKLDFLEIYVNNPDVCELLLLKKNDKIYGRAILWKIDKVYGLVDSNFKYFLDRIYTTDDFLLKTFINYAVKNNWAYKTYQSHNEKKSINYGKNKNIDVNMEVKVNKGKYNHYPYMDTFSRLDVRKGVLYNDSNFYLDGHILLSMSGDYSGINYSPIRFRDRVVSRFRDFTNRFR